jgi:hypothetical protein
VEAVPLTRAVGVLVVWLGLAGVSPPPPPSVEVSLPDAEEPVGQIFGVTRESVGAVTVTLTPKRHSEGRLWVDIAVNAQMVSRLEKYDLKKIVTLIFADQTIAPIAAPKLRGRYSSGQLVFPLVAIPRSFTIKIYGLEQPSLRIFSWPVDAGHEGPVRK